MTTFFAKNFSQALVIISKSPSSNSSPQGRGEFLFPFSHWASKGLRIGGLIFITSQLHFNSVLFSLDFFSNKFKSSLLSQLSSINLHLSSSTIFIQFSAKNEMIS
jgi:hypothetical protein